MSDPGSAPSTPRRDGVRDESDLFIPRIPGSPPTTARDAHARTSDTPNAPDGAAPTLPTDHDPLLQQKLDSAIAELKRERALVPAPEAPAPPAPAAPNSPPDEPDYLPARMLNEFVYCPRLFFYEHVDGIFVHNADTVAGAALHQRVDSGDGSLPPASGPATRRRRRKNEDAPPATDANPREPETIHSRSVLLSSDRLGVIAKLDLVETTENPDDLFAARTVCPVDYKAGSPREGPDGNELWDTDRIQLGLQCLILRDNGYTCDRGIIYYRGTRQRVELAVTPQLEAWILDRIAAARQCALGNIRPPPLDHSPKCPRCSLVTVCLPDETHLLAATPPAPDPLAPPPAASTCSAAAPRRLIAPRDDVRALYLNTQGVRVGISEGVLQIREGATLAQEVRLADLNHVALFGNVQLSTQAMHALCEAEIPLSLFSMGGWFYGLLRGHGLRNIFHRIAQFDVARTEVRCLDAARRFVAGKIRNQRTLLMRNHTSPPADAIASLLTFARRALHADNTASLLGLEGAAAALYFSHFAGMLKADDDEIPGLEGSAPRTDWPPAFDFHVRNRRPPRDPVNAMLSFAYSLLAKDCTLAAAAVGLDPYLGLYHQPRHGRPALALDVMEEFRPLVGDSTVLTAINNRMITPGDFIRAGDSVNLSPAGRKAFLTAYERRMNTLIAHPLFDYKVCYRRAIELQFRILARWFTGEIPEYRPFLTR